MVSNWRKLTYDRVQALVDQFMLAHQGEPLSREQVKELVEGLFKALMPRPKITVVGYEPDTSTLTLDIEFENGED